jgi:putative membrane protein
MRFSPLAGATLTVASAAALVALGALGACSSTTSTTSGTTPQTDVAAPAGPTRNTGAAVPTNPKDTTSAPPSGAANSVTAVGTGSASLGTGVTPGSGEANSMQASGSMSTAALGGDAHIVSLVDIINTGEIAEGMLARERATLPQIRAFANRMVQDHTQLQTQDRGIAKDPAFVAGDSAAVAITLQRQVRDQLAQLQQTPAGAPFDALYMNFQVTDHQLALNVLNAAKQQARDGQVLKLVNAAIPQVQQHLNEARQISSTMTAR